MPQLNFPITTDGLTVPVRVTVNSAALSSAIAAGQPLPNSIETNALIDTGTDVSAISPWILRQLGIRSTAQRITQGIGGKVRVRMFQVTLFIFDVTQPQLPWFGLPDLSVLEMPHPLPIDVLIGMDVIRACNLHVDGPGGQFTLDF